MTKEGGAASASASASGGDRQKCSVAFCGVGKQMQVIILLQPRIRCKQFLKKRAS